MSHDAEVLFANDAFYQFFRARDAEAMADLWAARRPVACIHPGWQALTSREEVMESWRAILSNPNAPDVACRAPRCLRHGDVALVVCYEVIGESVLAATNAFAREGGAWKMVHHQAGPCNLDPSALEDEEPGESPMQ